MVVSNNSHQTRFPDFSALIPMTVGDVAEAGSLLEFFLGGWVPRRIEAGVRGRFYIRMLCSIIDNGKGVLGNFDGAGVQAEAASEDVVKRCRGDAIESTLVENGGD